MAINPTNIFDVTDSIRRLQKENASEINRVVYFLERRTNRRKRYAVSSFLKEYGVGGVAIDYGVGFGNSLGEAARQHYICHGLDVEIEALVLSSLYINVMLQSSYICLMADLEICSFYGWFYDVAMCTDTLEHIKDDERVIQGIHTALVHDGLAIFSVPTKEPEAEFSFREITVPWGTARVNNSLRLYEEKSFLNLLERCGFKVLKTTTVIGIDNNKEYELLVVASRKIEE